MRTALFTLFDQGVAIENWTCQKRFVQVGYQPEELMSCC
jgi:hypothetical protein